MVDAIPFPRRGLMLVLSSPSGAGKSTLSRAVLAADENIEMSVSATTRPQRPGEVEGRDYFFKTPEQFDAMVAGDAFLEWAHVFGHRYGTPAAPVDAMLARGHDVLFDIDWQGTQQLRQKQVLADLVSIFILPPSMAELERRLRARGTDSDDVIAGRMARAEAEISHWAEYDYVLINRDVDACLAHIRTILAAERLKRVRQPGLVDFVRGLDTKTG
ncbi:guanylate kinase [Tardibacter chloracetimidivorans]|uniref:Guanylate kinase n=1 Tax=Tardibacter chloracetimidivorans TaxID=1921510 RepID=A0A1L3ZYJ5_9SPHN|nr:guanylate kinase [Tardibacter chloracetimidivorans]API60701.1 guanylate kinase [Tardibacter chloracetimidivorans]